MSNKIENFKKEWPTVKTLVEALEGFIPTDSENGENLKAAIDSLIAAGDIFQKEAEA